MAVTINASTTAGLVQTADTSGVLALQTAGTTAVTVDASQNVGIGTSSPRNKTDTVGNVGIYSSGASSVGSPLGAQLYIGDSNYNTASYYNAAPGIGAVYDATYASAAALAFYTYAGTPNSRTERMRIDSSGNVGIGTSSPESIANFTFLSVGGSSSTKGVVQTYDGTVKTVLYSNGTSVGTVGTRTAHPLSFIINGSETMRIDSSGNLLVGTTANAISAYSASKSLVQSADYSGAVAMLTNSTSTSGTQYFIAFGRGGSVCGQITSGATNSTTYATSSDYRLKKDVQPMKGALAKVQALKPCTYKWIEDDTTSEGFIAHELAEVCPDAVVGEKDAVNAEGNPIYQGVDTSFLVATLTAAIQEQQAIITQLQADVAALKGA